MRAARPRRQVSSQRWAPAWNDRSGSVEAVTADRASRAVSVTLAVGGLFALGGIALICLDRAVLARGIAVLLLAWSAGAVLGAWRLARLRT